MDFIKNNKLACTLGVSCLLMGVISIATNSSDNASDVKKVSNDNTSIASSIFSGVYNNGGYNNNVNKQPKVFAQNFLGKDFILRDLIARNVAKGSASSKATLNNYASRSSVLESGVGVGLHFVNNEMEVEGLLQSESQKLIKESSAILKARLQYNEDEIDNIGIVSKEYEQANLLPKDYVDYKVVKGDTLTKVFLKNGDTVQASLKAYDTLKKANRSYASLRLGEILKIYKKDGKIDKIEKKLSLGRSVTLILSDNGSYKVSVYEPKIIEEDKVITGKISSCFSVEAKRLGIPNDVIDQFVDLFSSKVSFRSSLKRGDVFSIKYSEKKTTDGLFISAGNIKSASIINKGRFLSLVGYKGKSGKLSYYNEKGEPAGNYMLRYPLNFTRISSVFSDNRLHPILKRNRPHNGVDFAAPTGTPVRTVADGRIISAGWNKSAGKMIKIQHGPKYKTAYLHLSKIAPNVKVGAYVSRGDYIGNVGSTGLSTGPHLHYSFYVNNKYVDPLKVDLPSMPVGGDRIPNSYLKNAIAELRANTEDMMASKEDDATEA